MSAKVKEWLRFCGYGVVGVAAVFGLTGDLGMHDSSFLIIIIVGTVLGTSGYVGARFASRSTSNDSPGDR